MNKLILVETFDQIEARSVNMLVFDETLDEHRLVSMLASLAADKPGMYASMRTTKCQDRDFYYVSRLDW